MKPEGGHLPVRPLVFSRLRPIVAVFGGGKDNPGQMLALADRLGYAISSHESIVLTGGSGPKDKPVKNRAIKGAMSHASGCWVGVDREPGETPKGVPSDGGFAIKSTLNHQRNYLEACMADAAICLDGGDGTMSELASCLILGRPVALVGDEWENKCNLAGDKTEAISTLIAATVKRFAMTGEHKLAPHLTDEAAISHGLRHITGPYAYFPTHASENDILDWLLSRFPSNAPFPGSFPKDIAGHKDVARDYSNWLSVAGLG